jgi:hypothetical protein
MLVFNIFCNTYRTSGVTLYSCPLQKATFSQMKSYDYKALQKGLKTI